MTPIDARLDAALAGLTAQAPLHPAQALQSLVQQGLDGLPLPASGATLQRWRALAAVAGHDLSLAKLYEGHTDALAVLAELRANLPPAEPAVWGLWAAEAPAQRVEIASMGGGRVRLNGLKRWCSGAAHVTHGLLTAWWADGRGPQLVQVAMAQPGVMVDAQSWHAVGMADSSSLEVRFGNAHGVLLGEPGDYLRRPGFWQGGAGVAACWYGGARSLAAALHRSLRDGRSLCTVPAAHQLASLGRIDTAMAAAAAVLTDAADWIDEHPAADAHRLALRTRLVCEGAATRVLDEACRAMGPTALCRDAHFARLVADLPVFLRQSHGDRDLAALGGCIAAAEDEPWRL